MAINRSLIAPTAFVENSDHFIVGEKYLRILNVTKLPEVYGLAFLSQFVTNPKVKVYVNMNRLNVDINKHLRDDYDRKLQALDRTKDKTYQQRLIAEMNNLNEYIQESIRRSDATWNYSITMMIVEDDKQKLDDLSIDITTRLRNADVYTRKLIYLQQGLFKKATGLFLSTGLFNEIEYNLGVPLPSTSVAGLYPFVFETLKDKYGFLLAYERNNGGALIVNPYLYLYDKPKSIQEDRVNGNIIIVGVSGSGKTTAMYVIIRYLIKETKKTIWIDPESVNEGMCRKHGVFIDWGTEESRINIFDLKHRRGC